MQGMTGSEGMKHTRRMVAAGTNIVGGVNPRKAGEQVDGIPVFGSVGDAVEETGADVSVVFVPPRFARAAVEEASTPRCRWWWSSPRASRCTTPPRSSPARSAPGRPGSSGPTAPA